jgi:hypothetical protein
MNVYVLFVVERFVEELLKFEKAEEGGGMVEVFNFPMLFAEAVPLST